MSGAAGDVLVPPGTIGYLDAISAGAGATVSSTSPRPRRPGGPSWCGCTRSRSPASASSAAPSRSPGFEPIEREGIEQTTAIGSYGRADPLGLDQFDAPLTVHRDDLPDPPRRRPPGGDRPARRGRRRRLEPRPRPRRPPPPLVRDRRRRPRPDHPRAAEAGLLVPPRPQRSTPRPPARPSPSTPSAPSRQTASRPAAATLTASKPTLPGSPQPAAAPLLLAAAALDPNGQPLEGFDGKIEAPSLAAPASTAAVGGDPGRTSPQFVREGSPPDAAPTTYSLASWDASQSITRTGIDHPSLLTDTSPPPATSP